ncbi:type I polyketide synthase [Nannocystis radixulma]|uniref:SDR family NAD(P)-dependent oxidoreductase n=1 Tax=Nannocystis radixulma TaxID=2995305 RepID=A0ABT5B0X6_9BACT|nr:type I polyketide synthase [Nannocystis radixulma]MDC0667756.1 SDR family NAD(P)-dependent oxidoreductase [Nannocystis radixulma]
MGAERITLWVCDWLARTLQIDRATIDPRRRLFDLGLGSLQGVALAAELAAMLARPVSPTLLWEHPTIAELAAHLAGAAAPRPVAAPSTPTQREPVAIVGMACRFPRAPDLAAFWRLVADCVDATDTVPADRWDVAQWTDPDPHAPGKSVTARGAFLADVRGFEPLFFGISPREADELDPQQRLALELTWEALEHAGIPPRGLAGSRTGVYLGSMWHDWADLTHAHVAGMSSHRATGTANNLIANRVSYAFGLRGPSMVIDTACSSALVAIHLGCQALAFGDAELVIAGAVNLLLAPESSVFCSKFGGLAPDGRCKAFDAAADGFARGEGGGVVVLKPLSRALADGDRIHAIVRGTAVNNDGASQGLTAPNPRAQEEVLRTALARADVDPTAVHYVEAHGTGTLLGDPIEAAALGAVLGAGRPDEHPLAIGSVKTNIGHTEGAAGIAGLIKIVLAMRHRAVPPSLHLRTPNPHIPFAALHLRVPTAREPWPAPLDAPALAGVSAFGWGGTNAHLVLETAPPPPRWLGVAADDADQLAAQLRQLLQRLETAELEDIAGDHGSATTWEPLAAIPAPDASIDAHRFRAAFVARSTDELRTQLTATLQNPSRLNRGASLQPRRLVFVCSPLGSQWLGMARTLLADEPVFRAAIARCDRVLAPLLSRSIRDDLAGAWQRVDDVVRVQPLLFAVQVGLAELFAAWGFVPHAVVGHSAGEIAAAHIAGALTLEDAARVVHHYARVQQASAGAGAMAVVALGRSALESWLAPHAGRVVVGAHNSASSTVITGEAAAVAELTNALQLAGVACSPIRTDVAGHSPLVAPGLADLARALTDLEPSPPRIPLHSTVTGERMDGLVGGAYWAANLGQPVRFDAAIRGLLGSDTDVVELGPHPVVTHAIQQLAEELGVLPRVLPTLRRGADERQSLFGARSALFIPCLEQRNAPIAALEPSPPPQLVVLSARSAAALDQSRTALADRLATHPIDPAALSATTLLRRSHLEHRLTIVGNSRRALADALRRASLPPPTGPRPRLVFVFPGQGSQWLGMGRALVTTQPAFRERFDACARALAPHIDRPLHAELAEETADRLDRSDVVQPLLWAFGVALAALWRDLGVVPDAVVGHSMGEVAAACVAGALSLDDSARIIALRSRIARALADGRGAMAVVELSLADAEQAVADVFPRIVVGVHNGPRACVLSGEPGPLADVLVRLEARGVFCRRVRVDYASHGPQMAALAGPLHDALAGIAPRPGDVPMFSTLTAAWESGAGLDPAYWVANIRERVRFADAVTTLLRSDPDAPTALWDGQPRVFLEVSPHPVLLAAIRDALPSGHLALGTLRRDEDERACLLEAVGALHVAGLDLDLARLHPDPAPPIALPPVAWQRTSHWFSATPTRPVQPAGHPLLGPAFTTPALPGAHVFSATLSADLLPYLADHRVGDAVVVPGAAWLDLVLAAAAEIDSPARTLADVRFDAALMLPDSGAAPVQVVLAAEGDDLRFTCHGRAAASWTVHATGLLRSDVSIRTGPNRHVESDMSVSPFPQGHAANDMSRSPSRPADHVYTDLAARGLVYGPRCRPIRELTLTPDCVTTRLARPADSDVPGTLLHPVLLDGAMHSLVALLADPDDPRPYVPAALHRLQLHRQPGDHATAVARLVARAGDRVTGDIELRDHDGNLLVTLEGLELQRLAGARVRHADLLVPTWRELPPVTPGTSAPRRWLLVADRHALADDLQRHLETTGARVDRHRPGAPLLGGPWDDVLHLAGLAPPIHDDDSGDDVLRRAVDLTAEALDLAQQLLRRPDRDRPRLWLLTRGAQRVGPADPPPDPLQAPLWGLGLTLTYEHPELRCVRLDLPADDAQLAATLPTVLAELRHPSGDDQLTLRGARRLGARLSPGTAVDATAPDFTGGPVLVTGGLGGLGLALAEWLVVHGAHHLILLGRSGATTDEQARTIARLGARARLDVHRLDVADEAALAELLISLDAPLVAVFHAAGVLDDGVLLDQNRERLRRVMASKIAGAWNLHRLTRRHPLRQFVLYGSVASLIGSPGQSNYAAANAFLDALAEHRHARGLPALTIHWGALADVGLAARDVRRGDRLAARGMLPLSLARAHAHLARLLVDPAHPRIGVAPFDPRQWLEFHPALAASPLLAELRPPDRPATHDDLRRDLAHLSLADRTARLEQFVRDQVLRVLRVDVARVHRRVDLLSLGLDSLTGLELRNRLEAGLGLALPATLAWTYPRLDVLAAHLAQRFGDDERPTPPPAAPGPLAVDDDALDQLSDDELMRALAAELNRT